MLKYSGRINSAPKGSTVRRIRVNYTLPGPDLNSKFSKSTLAKEVHSYSFGKPQLPS